MDSASTLSENISDYNILHPQYAFPIFLLFRPGRTQISMCRVLCCDPCVVSFTQAGETGMSALRKFSRAGINMAATTVVSSAMRVGMMLHVP